MKKLIATLVCLFYIGISITNAQKVYKYETVPNDPLNARIYQLSITLILKKLHQFVQSKSNLKLSNEI